VKKDIYWKIAGAVIAFLLSLAVWFAQTELLDLKAQNKAQWAQAAKDRDCFQQRLSHLEGWHECERQLKK
jgi:hypothetical protein